MPNSQVQASEEYITPREASDIAVVTTKTLARMGDEGAVSMKKLPSGHRRYLRSDVERLLQEATHAEGGDAK